MTTPPPIRLINNDGVQSREGLVEVQFAGKWGVICINDGDDNLISTICRQLGYSGGGTTGATTNVYDRRIWLRKKYDLDGADCPDDAARIDQCISFGIGYGSCRPNANESLQIQCEGKIVVNFICF